MKLFLPRLSELLNLVGVIFGGLKRGNAQPTPGAIEQTCYCLPEDGCWPSTAAWDALNSTVNGQLIATVPIGSPCHDPTYDAAACAALQADWTNPLIHEASSSSIMQTYFANQSCDPFTDRSKPCTLGNYVSYAVKVATTDDIKATLAFAQASSIRVLVRNTGHDFLGRSTGAGALAIWTQDLKDISFSTWSDNAYTGPAATVGAGVLGYEIVEAAHAQNLTVVTGECATVGLAGGFTQGGGHSALSTTFGLGADQALSYQVVLADGSLVTATATKNSDLYWALSGGGGGSYGVVVSLTVRAYQATQVGGAGMQLLAASTTSENYAAAVKAFHDLLPGMVDKGAMVVYIISSQYLVIKPVTVWNSNATYVRDEVLAPFAAALANLGINQSITYTTLSYRDHYATFMGPLPKGSFEVTRYQFGGRLIPRSVLEADDTTAFSNAISNLIANGVLLAGSGGSYAKPSNAPNNAVLPAWRNAVSSLQLITNWDSTAPWADMEAAQKRMTEEFVPSIEAVTPGSGAYMNEADFRQPNWQDVFFGSNFNKLKKIKEKYDPDSMFYILKGVGSEDWTVANDGRMCRA